MIRINKHVHSKTYKVIDLSNLWVIWKNNVPISIPNMFFCWIVEIRGAERHYLHNCSTVKCLSHTLSDAQPRLGHLCACTHCGCLVIIKSHIFFQVFGWFRNTSMDWGCHPYWSIRYKKKLGHRCQYLKNCSTYEQHPVTCVRKKTWEYEYLLYWVNLSNNECCLIES